MIFYISDGRLGNQLFQYVFLNTIAKAGERIYAINMRQFAQSVEFENKRFKLILPGKYGLFFLEKIIKPFVVQVLVRFKIIGYLKQKRTKVAALPRFERFKGILPIIYVESDFFQAEEFFEKNSVDFKINDKYINQAREFLASIPKEFTKVFVHVRRGDYLYESFLGVRGINLPKSYFDTAMDTIRQEVKNPFFVFLSDDPEFVNYCFSEVENKIISYNEMTTDLAIMSFCEYGVVSNSSFSWWGAYLMNKRKEVIFPNYWYGWKSKTDSHIGIQPVWAKVIDIEC